MGLIGLIRTHGIRQSYKSYKSYSGFPKLIPLALFIATFAVYYFSHSHSDSHSDSYYDYTFRIAQALLDGKLGLTERPPDWLNEMVPLDGQYYSAFPLGAVLAMLPVAALKRIGLIELF